MHWNCKEHSAGVTVTSNMAHNCIKLRCGRTWTEARVNDDKQEIFSDEMGQYLSLKLNANESVTVEFVLGGDGDSNKLPEYILSVIRQI
ncbi:MAG: hypothetical protein ACI4R5_00245 [Acetatifactor sp.]